MTPVEIRIFAVGLEGPSALRYPGQVELGTLDHVEALPSGLGPLDLARRIGDGRVEAGGDADGRRELGDTSGAVADAVGPSVRVNGGIHNDGTPRLALSMGVSWARATTPIF